MNPILCAEKTRSLNLHPEQHTKTNKTGCQEVYNIYVNIVCWNFVEVFCEIEADTMHITLRKLMV